MVDTNGVAAGWLEQGVTAGQLVSTRWCHAVGVNPIAHMPAKKVGVTLRAPDAVEVFQGHSNDYWWLYAMVSAADLCLLVRHLMGAAMAIGRASVECWNVCGVA
jgi:hypothetical protein